MEARDKKILIQSVSAVLIIVVLFNVYSGITVSKIGIPGLLDIEFNPGNKTNGDNGAAGKQHDPVQLVSPASNNLEKSNDGPLIENDSGSGETPANIYKQDDPEVVYNPNQPDRSRPGISDLNGMWYGDDGSEYEITQNGGEIYFTEYGLYGITAQGMGRYLNNQFIFEYETVFGTVGTATLTLSQDGRALSGRANDLTSGAITQLYLTRE